VDFYFAFTLVIARITSPMLCRLEVLVVMISAILFYRSLIELLFTFLPDFVYNFEQWHLATCGELWSDSRSVSLQACM